MYNPYFPSRARAPRFPLGWRILVAGLLVVLLVICGLLYWLAVPAWQLRLAGVQTRAIAHATGDCGSSSDSPDTSWFSYEFTATNGRVYTVPRESFCTNVYHDGDAVTVWYMPANPSNMLSEGEAIILYIVSAMGVGSCLILLIAILGLLARPLMRTGSRNYRYYNRM